MCHFLTISVPAQKVPEVPKTLRREVHFAKQLNRSVTVHAPPDWISFVVTSGGCSCDFYRSGDDSPDDESKRISKYRKQGWSEAKIQRVIESMTTATMRSVGLRDDIVEMVADFTHAFGQIRLSLHWYSGDIETESFSLNDFGRVLLADFKLDTTIFKDESTLTIEEASYSNRH
jgi:hypothetical protein